MFYEITGSTNLRRRSEGKGIEKAWHKQREVILTIAMLGMDWRHLFMKVIQDKNEVRAKQKGQMMFILILLNCNSQRKELSE